MKKLLFLISLSLFSIGVYAQVVPQTIALTKGWNALYLRVDPGVSADEFFAAWPVEHVSLFDSGSFLRTAQFVTDTAIEPTLERAYLVWHRELPDASTLKNVIGDRIYVCFAKEAFEVMVYGRPCVQRMAWHPASTGSGETSLNFFGISLEPGVTVSPTQYLQGLDTAYTLINRVAGGNPMVMSMLPATNLKDGGVIIMDGAKISDWSGPLFLTPVSGIDFGDQQSLAVFSVRNSAATQRTVSLTYSRSQGAMIDLEPPQLEMMFKSPSNTWDNVPPIMSKSLAPQESWSLMLAIDRSQFHGVVGAKRAGIITVRDVDGSSQFCAHLPVAALGGTASTIAKAAWPAGLWLTEINMNRVTHFQSDTTRTDGTLAGGIMVLRAILHVDLDSNLKLLQRVLIAAQEETDQTNVSLHLSQDSLPATATVTRLSTVDMGVDNQVVMAEAASEFRQAAAFHFNVAPDARSNPFRHAYHPDHDGLQWDFTTPAPSGNDFNNYVGTVKPETFAVSNVVSFTWSEKSARIAVWDPQETLEGNCRWELHGLRRQGSIYVDGTFTMSRVSTVGALIP